MNLKNHERGVLYEMLANITGKKRQAVKMHFYRRGLDILNTEHFMDYANSGRNTKSI